MENNHTFERVEEEKLSIGEATNENIKIDDKRAITEKLNSRLVLFKLDFWCKNVE